jgi:N-formylglutamate amidohydrolase
MTKVPYRLRRPEKRTSCVVFSSPHSGCAYPAEMLDRSVLDAQTLRSSEDAYVDRLFENAPNYGATLLNAVYPRAWVDLNRRSDELDPALIETVLGRGLNARVLSGLGVIPRVVAGGRAIYSGKLTRAEADLRIARVWQPYHLMLETLLRETKTLFGQVLLIDCHSMPREALKHVRTPSGVRPQIVLGDRYGASAHEALVDGVEAAFRAEGFDVMRNVPFAGAYISQHYGRPAQHQHCIQIEIDRSLYMDERTLVPSGAYGGVKRALDNVARRIAQLDAGCLPLAAE